MLILCSMEDVVWELKKINFKEIKMPHFRLIKDGKEVNAILADQNFIDLISDEFDSIEEVITQPQEIPVNTGPKLWNSNDIRNNLTFAEKITWDNNGDPAIVTAKIDLPQELPYVQELTSYLVSANVISQNSATKILAL